MISTASIAFSNVKRSIKNYSIYFITLTLGVCIFYVFNSFESQSALINSSTFGVDALKLLDRAMGVVSVFISFILGFLIVYANQFLIKRRKKEFGIYTLLGMKQRRILSILIMETIFVGLVSLFIGLILGVFLSQFMAVVTAKILVNGVVEFVFIYSHKAAVKAVMYFGLIFLVVLLFNIIVIKKQKLLNLLYEDKKNEQIKEPKMVVSYLALGCSISMLFIAYLMVLNGINVLNSDIFGICILLGVIGTALFFYSLANVILKLVQSNKSLYYKNLNMFVLRQIKSKMLTTWISLTIVCLILFVAIVAFSSGFGISKSLYEQLQKRAPFDATLIVDGVRDRIDELNNRIADTFEDYYLTRYYAAPSINLRFESGIESYDAYYMSLSDLNSVLKMRGIKPVALSDSNYAINFSAKNDVFMKAILEYAGGDSGIYIKNTNLETNMNSVFDYEILNSENSSYNIMLIVDDLFVENLSVKLNVFLINYQEGDDNSLLEEILSEFDDLSVTVKTRAQIEALAKSYMALLAFLSVYIGLIFLITSAAVIAITQLSQTSDNVYRYDLLAKLGASNKVIRQALFLQILIYFGIPMLLALLHACIGIVVISNVITFFDKGDILVESFISTLILLFIYSVYFLATYSSGKKILITVKKPG